MASHVTWVSALLLFLVGLVWSEIHPIDVEPMLKKEQADFEDDTGLGAVVPAGSGEKSPNSSTNKNDDKNVDVNFTNAFIAALSMIVVTELGDKTFFIAAIMAMNHARLTVFGGAMSALTIMHIVSSLFGYVITWIPRVYTFYASSALFAIFGLKMLREGCKMKADEGQEEMEEVQMDLRRRDEEEDKQSMEEGGVSIRRASSRKNPLCGWIPRIYLQALTMTFLAEWGDRSQIATVVMAAREDVYGVVFGGLLGHFLCTGLAVIGGRMIATKISVKTVTIIGGVTFLIFACSALIIGP